MLALETKDALTNLYKIKPPRFNTVSGFIPTVMNLLWFKER